MLSIVIMFLVITRQYSEFQINVSKNWKQRTSDNIISDNVCHFNILAHQY